MKNLRLALKMGIGFGVVLLITCVLGIMAIVNMHSAEEGSERMKLEMVPEVGIANDVELHVLARSMMRAMPLLNA